MRAEKVETEIRREQIARAALEIVGAHGLKGLTIERIASLVGVVPSALYRHYKGKNQVFDAVVETLHDTLMSIIKEARKCGNSPLERIKHVLLLHLRFAMQFPGAPRIIFSDEILGGPTERKQKFAQAFRSFMNSLSEMFAEAQKNGSIRSDIDPRLFPSIYLGIFAPTMLQYQLSEGRFDMFKHAECMWNLLYESIKAI